MLAVLALAPAAHAGIADSPVPNLDGASPNATKARYSVTGVINNSGLGTYFACTSTSGTPGTAGVAQHVAVELFDANAGGGPVGPANNAFATQLTLNPGETVLFGTALGLAWITDQVLGGPAMAKGSARVLSTSKSLVCTAFTSDTAGR